MLKLRNEVSNVQTCLGFGGHGPPGYATGFALFSLFLRYALSPMHVPYTGFRFSILY